MKYLLTVWLLPVVFSFAKPHEYYVSVTNVEYVQEQKSIQIISQIFIDDFEEALRRRYNETIVLAGTNEPEVVNSLMERYLKSRIKLWVNGKEVQFEFLGKEYKDDITYCYLEVLDVLDVENIVMRNEILHEIFETQQNIVRFKIRDKNKSFLSVRDNAECMLNFD